MPDKHLDTEIYHTQSVDEKLNVPQLFCLRGLEAGKCFNVDQSVFIIGRVDTCHLKLTDASISRKHAQIVREMDEYILSDLESTNGTRINGKLLSGPLSLVSNDTVAFGEVVFKFLLEKNAEVEFLTQIQMLNYEDRVTTVKVLFDFERQFADMLRDAHKRKCKVVLAAFVPDQYEEIKENHDFYDDLVVGLVSRVKDVLPESAQLYRISEEKFCVILIDENHDSESTQKLLAALLQSNVSYGSDQTLTLSMGVSSRDYSTCKYEESHREILLFESNRALVMAQISGGNCFKNYFYTKQPIQSSSQSTSSKGHSEAMPKIFSSSLLMSTSHDDVMVRQVQNWLDENYSKSFGFDSVAETFNFSVRNFKRRFKIATGYTPLKYLQALRIERAKYYLQISNLSIQEITYKVGYEDANAFNKLFRDRVGVSMSIYREESKN